MGLSKDYSDVPAWEHKATGYNTGEKVKSQGNIFMAHFWASSDPKDAIDPNKEGWRLYDELYDVTTTKKTERANIIAYIPTWRKKEGFKYDNEEMYRYITHGIIAFLMFSESNVGEFDSQSLNDVNLIISDVVSTGHANNTKILIALGGATDYGFLQLMERIGNNPSDPIVGQTVQKVVDFVKSNNLDGVDLDLECWWDKNSDASKDQGGRPKSQGPHPAGRGLTEFAKQLKKAMPDKIFSVAVFATSWYGNNYDPELVNYLDWVGIMSYDLTGSWNASPVGPHTAIDQIRKQEPYIEEQQGEWPGGGNTNNPILSVEESLWYWTNPFFTNWQGTGQNFPRNKIAAGVPIYGYDFAYGKEPDDLSGQIAPGYKVIRYQDLLNQFPDAHTAKNANIKVPGNTPRPPFVSAPGTYPYAHNIYFETPTTAVAKLNFLKNIGAQGVIIWELSNDVWEEGKSIIKALYQNSGNPKKKQHIALGQALGQELNLVTSDGLWGEFKADNCTGYGLRQYSARLWDIQGSWEDACHNAPAVIKGQRFDKPNRCVNKGISGIWGEFDVKDISCIPHWGEFKKDHSTGDGLHQYSSRLWDIPSELDWEQAASQTPATIKGQYFSQPTRVKRSGIAEVWGEFDVKDEHSDQPLWGEFKADNCTGYGLRQYSARLWDIQGSWEDACHNAPAVIKGQRFDKPNRCVNKGISGMWGEFDVNDISCIPHWGEFKKDHSTGDGLHQYSSRLWDIPSELDWEQAASQTPATIKGQYFPQPTRVKRAGIAEVWGEFDVKDESNFSKGDENDLSNWIEVKGENSYCYCACNNATDNKQRHASNHTMNVKEGAPYLYAVLTKDDDSIDFPTGAVLTIEGPDGTKYDRDIQEENQLVVMSGSSVRCLIIKDPKPGDWKMTMTVPEGVGFHCECNTVPSKDVYDTITNALSKRDLTKHDKRDTADIKGWIGSALVGILIGGATIASGGTLLLAGTLAAIGGGGTWILTKNDSPRATAEYMSFTSRIRPIVEKLVTDLKEKGFKETISFYYSLIGKNLSVEEWKVILTTQPWNAASIVLVYAQVFKIIEHMTDAEEQNAVRHVLWQCLLKQRFGAEFATKLGDAHEKARPGSDADNKADEINNIKGQQLADEVRSDLECFKRAREMWEAGELQTRTDLEGDPN
jgi:GH18 family chitinase